MTRTTSLRTPVPSRPPPRPAAGFTLIELLVVIVIIGILSVSVAFSVTQDSQRTALREAHRLATLLEIAMTETQSGKRRLAWSARPEGYEFLAAETAGPAATASRWNLLTDDTTLHPRKLPDDVRILRVEVEHQPLPADNLLTFRRGDPPLFHIVLGSGENSTARTIELRSQPTGQIDVLPGE